MVGQRRSDPEPNLLTGVLAAGSAHGPHRGREQCWVSMHFVHWLVLTRWWESAVQLTISETKNDNLEDLCLIRS